jgi:hypothetical protein
MKNNLTEARLQFLAGVINENEFKQLNEVESQQNNQTSKQQAYVDKNLPSGNFGGDDNKIKLYIDNPYYNPEDEPEDLKYLANTDVMVDTIKKYAAQNNIKLNPEQLKDYEELLDAYGTDWGPEDVDYGFDAEMTPKEVYKDYLEMNYFGNKN